MVSRDVTRHDSSSWEATGFREWLDHDPRPSLVLDLEDLENPNDSLAVVYTNPAFDETYETLEILKRDDAFGGWLRSPTQRSESETFGLWTAITFRSRWRVISGSVNLFPAQVNDILDCGRSQPFGVEVQMSSSPPLPAWNEHRNALKEYPWKGAKRESFDITAEQAPRTMTPHVAMLRRHDWSKTPLGPMNSWSAQLRLVVNLLICDTNPACLWWGPELAGIYNEGFTPCLLGKHPKSLGEPYGKIWTEILAIPETCKVIDAIWERGYSTCEVTRQDAAKYHLLLDDKLTEFYFSLSVHPILAQDGSVAGFYEPLTDVTKSQLSIRRQMTINTVSDQTSGVQTFNDFFVRVLGALEDSIYDVPFCLLYSIDADPNTNGLPSVEDTNLSFAKLEGTIGVQLDNDGKPLTLLLNNDPFKIAFKHSCQSGKITTFPIEPDLSAKIMHDATDRGYGDASEELVLCPIKPTTQKTTAALLVLGVNTRTPYDTVYQSFVQSLTRTISSSMASLMLFNIASRRQLEAVRGEQIAKGMLHVAPVGVFLINMEGVILYANPVWYEITEYNKWENDQKPMSWMSTLHDESLELMTREWGLLLTAHKPRSFELKLKRTWRSTDPVSGAVISGPFFILAESSLQTVDDTPYIMGCITDISRQKWAEDRERQRREEAVELKRQQENFIDMTSHEIRNPLSAIFQSADGIVSALSMYQNSALSLTPRKSSTASMSSPRGATRTDDNINYAIEAAGTIALCAQHQRRIIDDILVLSKMDANLLEISGIVIHPVALIEKSLQMFAAELSSNDVRMEIYQEKSFSELNVDWVILDPSRLLQVLVNLCTNAIKFTVKAPVRTIRIAIGASLAPPTGPESSVRWLPSSDKIRDPTRRPDFGDGQQLYLTLAVQDSGLGISEEEMKKLFQRFSQASPKTHTQYGGSGLGLFIARMLTQLQGGEIGVVSTPGKGSTFAFYVRVRRTCPPAVTIEEKGTQDRADTPKSVAIPVRSGPGFTSSHLKELHVLVAEDNIVNQRVLRKQLENLGWTVHVANNGNEAIDFLKTTTFWVGNNEGLRLDLILMDIEMPQKNGDVAAREIRTLQAIGQVRGHVPIIAITANARVEQLAVARDSGMDDVVSKPFRIPELVAKVEAMMGSRDKT